MATSIKLSVIELKKSKALTVYRLAFLFTFMGFIILFIVLNDKNNQIGRAFLITMLSFIIAAFFLRKPSSKIGFLTISKNELIYSTSTITELYLTKDISEISFWYDRYRGEPRTLDLLLLSSGHGNVLKFKHKGDETEFIIELKYEFIGVLRRVFKEFESAGVPINVLNTRGKKIEL